VRITYELDVGIYQNRDVSVPVRIYFFYFSLAMQHIVKITKANTETPCICESERAQAFIRGLHFIVCSSFHFPLYFTKGILYWRIPSSEINEKFRQSPLLAYGWLVTRTGKWSCIHPIKKQNLVSCLRAITAATLIPKNERGYARQSLILINQARENKQRD
jgi:hypothetical protein